MITLVLVGLLIGILASGTGLGGGFLVVPYLLMLGKDARLAVGTSFIYILIVAISSLIAHFREGNLDVKTGLLLGLGGVVGAQLGPLILKHVPNVGFKWAFGLFLIGVGVWTIAQTRA